MEHITHSIVEDSLRKTKFDFSSTQKRLSFPVICRIYKKMKSGIKFSAIKVDEDLIIDGHHRYIASILAELPIETAPSQKTSVTNVVDWSKVEIDSEDWDTEAKIKMLNAIDAEFNNTSFEKIDQLIK